MECAANWVATGVESRGGVTARGSIPPHSAMQFFCPRCKSEVDQDFYAPCEDICVPELRSTMRREAEEVEQQDYEPKMNVTPNSVATKD